MDIRSCFSLKTIRSVFLGVGASFLLMLILSFLAAIVVYNTKMLETSLYASAIIVEVFAVFGGSYLAARLHGSRGLLIGLACGITVFILMLLFGPSGDISLLLRLLYCAVIGMVGGFLGIK
jgi:putative membrane protein (TIGR04086 family)